MLCAEWCTSVDSRRLSTVELKSVFLAVDSGAWYAISDAWTRRSPPKVDYWCLWWRRRRGRAS
eukprot:290167-Prorocentrum_minimum.AAC.1